MNSPDGTHRDGRTRCNRSCTPSGRGRITEAMDLLTAPLATTEFLAVDTETNGLSGDGCELTEIGAVLAPKKSWDLEDVKTPKFEPVIRSVVPA